MSVWYLIKNVIIQQYTDMVLKVKVLQGRVWRRGSGFWPRPDLTETTWQNMWNDKMKDQEKDSGILECDGVGFWRFERFGNHEESCSLKL